MFGVNCHTDPLFYNSRLAQALRLPALKMQIGHAGILKYNIVQSTLTHPWYRCHYTTRHQNLSEEYNSQNKERAYDIYQNFINIQEYENSTA